MYRRYSISIEATGLAAHDLQNLEKELSCSISEPSNWVAYGSTKNRGLTFLDMDGKELASSVFIHQPIFNASPAEDEIAEIRDFIYQSLRVHWPVATADVRIKVTTYNHL